jgi:acyl carrier protein
MDTRDSLRTLVIDELQWEGTREELTDDLPLIDASVLDSFEMLRLVSLIEARFGIQIRDEDLVPRNFGTIESLAAFVDSRRKGEGPS